MIKTFEAGNKIPIEIDISDLNKGVYFLQLKNIKNGFNGKMKKIIKL